MKNARGDGRTIVHTASGAAIASGAFVAVGGVVGVAAESVADGENVTLFIEGEFEGPSTGAPAQGTPVVWNGTAWAAAAAGVRAQGVVTSVRSGNARWIKLTPGGTGA